MKTLDMRGNPCPIPVVSARKALAENDVNNITVIVDNITAVQNLEKMAKGTGCSFSYEEDGKNYKVLIIKGNEYTKEITDFIKSDSFIEKDNKLKNKTGSIVFISSDSMGRGSEELGKILIKGFIFSLTQLNPPPEAIIFINSGVRLTIEGANTVPDLKTLEEKGTKIYICGTCANYYNLTESIAVGTIVDMMFITDQLSRTGSIITV